MNKVHEIDVWLETPAAAIAAGASLYRKAGGSDKLLLLLLDVCDDDNEYARQQLRAALTEIVSGVSAAPEPEEDEEPQLPKPSAPPVLVTQREEDKYVKERKDKYVARSKLCNKLGDMVDAALAGADNLAERAQQVAYIHEANEAFKAAAAKSNFVQKHGYHPDDVANTPLVKLPTSLVLDMNKPAHELRQQLQNVRSLISKSQAKYMTYNKSHPASIKLEARIKKALSVKAKLEAYFQKLNGA